MDAKPPGRCAAEKDRELDELLRLLLGGINGVRAKEARLLVLHPSLRKSLAVDELKWMAARLRSELRRRRSLRASAEKKS